MVDSNYNDKNIVAVVISVLIDIMKGLMNESDYHFELYLERILEIEMYNAFPHYCTKLSNSEAAKIEDVDEIKQELEYEDLLLFILNEYIVPFCKVFKNTCAFESVNSI